MIKSAGAVLLTTIIMVTLLATLILSLTHALLLYIHASSHLISRHNSFYQLENSAAVLSLSKNLPPSCGAGKQTPNQLIDLLLSGKGCLYTHAKQRYYYLWQDLGDYPCLRINAGKNTYASHHLLISLRSSEGDVLQLRLGTVAIKDSSCKTGSRVVNNGILSWRYLPSMHSPREPGFAA